MRERRSKRHVEPEMQDAMLGLLRTVPIDIVRLGGCSSAQTISNGKGPKPARNLGAATSPTLVVQVYDRQLQVKEGRLQLNDDNAVMGRNVPTRNKRQNQ